MLEGHLRFRLITPAQRPNKMFPAASINLQEFLAIADTYQQNDIKRAVYDVSKTEPSNAERDRPSLQTSKSLA